MIRKICNYILAFCLVPILINCSERQSTETDATNYENTETTPSQNEVSLSEIVSPEFPDAMLEMNTPLDGAEYDTGEAVFQFNVKNYTLTAQTLDADTKQCANSGKGQHIHLILNGAPYNALYEPEYKTDLEDGNYVALAFLSRSYHESVKHYGAYALRQFSVGDAPVEAIDLTASHLFYSRPKGEYKGKDTERVLLDFYLVNTDLSPDGNKVRATINGKEFIIDKWAPYFIEGLPLGENSIKLELVDNQENPVEGPYNSVERTISLVEGDAI